ncbi:DUF1653 domain-containing protein [Bacillus sp. Brlt_9]|uniref:DUF1653 domain-containing protein n=1 Tax=Bacillus sp. Brlt_9 TaxID=3110916 RepID=UPI003F7CAACA
MKYFDMYKHHKGDEYIYFGISIPLQDKEIKFSVHGTALNEVGVAKHEETLEPVVLYDYFGLQQSGGAGLIFTDSKIPLVIYQNVKDEGEENIWARPVDKFFGPTILQNGKIGPRFTLIK